MGEVDRPARGLPADRVLVDRQLGDRDLARLPGKIIFPPGKPHAVVDLVFELRNMLVVSEAIARSALERQESRGAHSRLDFVGQQEGWA